MNYLTQISPTISMLITITFKLITCLKKQVKKFAKIEDCPDIEIIKNDVH
ncbi:hypothetical protein ACVW2L_000256 [Mucilaginibacter sp. HD30]